MLSDNAKIAVCFLGGGAGWFIALLFSSLAAEAGCVLGLGQSAANGWILVLGILLLGLFTLGVALAATVGCWRLKTRLSQTPCRTDLAFLAHTGVIVNAVFALIIVVHLFPLWVFPRGC